MQSSQHRSAVSALGRIGTRPKAESPPEVQGTRDERHLDSRPCSSGVKRKRCHDRIQENLHLARGCMEQSVPQREGQGGQESLSPRAKVCCRPHRSARRIRSKVRSKPSGLVQRRRIRFENLTSLRSWTTGEAGPQRSSWPAPSAAFPSPRPRAQH